MDYGKTIYKIGFEYSSTICARNWLFNSNHEGRGTSEIDLPSNSLVWADRPGFPHYRNDQSPRILTALFYDLINCPAVDNPSAQPQVFLQTRMTQSVAACGGSSTCATWHAPCFAVR